MNQPEILYPLQTPEQSKNTHLFLSEFVADCYDAGDRCMIQRPNILTEKQKFSINRCCCPKNRKTIISRCARSCPPPSRF